MPPPLSSLCGRQSISPRRANRNIAVGSHGQYVPTLTAAGRVNAAVSKWPSDL